MWVSVCTQLEQALKLAGGDLSGEDLGTRNLVQQNIELRKRLDEEHSNYKRKLQAYQDGQQRQASLVQKLQAKVQWSTHSMDTVRYVYLVIHYNTLTVKALPHGR